MLSPEELISIVEKHKVVPWDIIEELWRHVRHMEETGGHASSAAITVWLVERDYFTPEMAESIDRAEQTCLADQTEGTTEDGAAPWEATAAGASSCPTGPSRSQCSAPYAHLGHANHRRRHKIAPLIAFIMACLTATAVVLLIYFAFGIENNLASSTPGPRKTEEPRFGSVPSSSVMKASTYSPTGTIGDPPPQQPPAPPPPQSPCERLEERFKQAVLPTELQSVAQDALGEAQRALRHRDKELARKMLWMALLAARRSDNDALVKTVVLCLLDFRRGAKDLHTQVAITKPDRLVGPPVKSSERKSPIPSQARQTEVRALVREAYGGSIAGAKNQGQRQVVAKLLLDKAKATQPHETAERFVLLDLAEKEAIQAMDCATALAAIDERAAEFPIERLKLKISALETFAALEANTEQHELLANKAAELAESALEENDFAAAKDLAKLAVQEAEKSWHEKLLEDVGRRQREVQQVQSKHQSPSDFIDQLEKIAPDDPETNLRYGEYHCFTRGDWDRGLPHLALGNERLLQELAEQDLRGAVKPDEQVAIGDQWWNLDASGTIKSDKVKERANYWYRKARPELSGFVKDRIDQRLGPVKRPLEPPPAALDPVLAGAWQIAIGAHRERWIFRSNGTVAAIDTEKHRITLGTWKIVNNFVLVRWMPALSTWARLDLPLKTAGTQGVAWRGEKREGLVATKSRK